MVTGIQPDSKSGIAGTSRLSHYGFVWPADSTEDFLKQKETKGTGLFEVVAVAKFVKSREIEFCQRPSGSVA